MKRILPFLLCFIAMQSKATTWNVTVENFQFSPATLNVMIGDVIHWTWIGGSHTTTSVGIPVGAASWDNPINTTQTTFDYTVTMAGIYNYQCNFHSTFGMVASFTASGTLPVTFSAFNLTNKNNSPFLSWTTTSEINTDYFSIRKSIDGIHFNEIARVNASGSSSSQKNYTYNDASVSSGITYVYYTIAIVDKDGKSQLEQIKMYKNSLAAMKLILSISPNPVAGMGHITLQYNADKKGVMIATFSDMQGKTVLKTELSSEQGINYGHIHLMELPAGIYNIHFSLNGINESYKIVKN